eukprot:CAMPEP_0115082768 /NCGR_PEP_ID=MMETSP0227-20121206/20110_1 /TAXON_ID=89957 /ORGANISM="Polarella glacialis, Strain CCMP 1383" /LENGTH=222 /DNA_ID=CAMNT_0002470945 /DNA_START=118 /DNA_END=786 /DNA_ORIENTATION=-
MAPQSGLAQYMQRCHAPPASKSNFDALCLDTGKAHQPKQMNLLRRLQQTQMQQIRLERFQAISKVLAPVTEVPRVLSKMPPSLYNDAEAPASSVLFDALALDSTSLVRLKKRQERVKSRAARAAKAVSSNYFLPPGLDLGAMMMQPMRIPVPWSSPLPSPLSSSSPLSGYTTMAHQGQDIWGWKDLSLASKAETGANLQIRTQSTLLEIESHSEGSSVRDSD